MPRGSFGGVPGHRATAQWHTFALFQPAAVLLQVLGGRGLCVPGALGPSRGTGESYRLLVEMVGQVTLGLLQPTTVPEGGAWGHAWDGDIRRVLGNWIT